MNAVLKPKFVSFEEYLAAEELSDYKSEYYAGDIFAMAGGTINHNRIAGNVHFSLKLALKGKLFEVFIGDVNLHVRDVAVSTYPDVLVIKGQPEYWDNRRDVVCNAAVVVEVLSDSTKDYDRAGKFEIYRHLSDLQDYILVSQDKVHVEHFVKQSPNQWLLTEYNVLSDVLTIAQLQETLAVADIYDKVEFEFLPS
jgi:Uma2 family endonuclease